MQPFEVFVVIAVELYSEDHFSLHMSFVEHLSIMAVTVKIQGIIAISVIGGGRGDFHWRIALSQLHNAPICTSDSYLIIQFPNCVVLFYKEE